MRIVRTFAAIALGVASLLVGAAPAPGPGGDAAAQEKGGVAPTFSAVFLAPADGVRRATADEVRLGLRTAFATKTVTDPEIALREVPLPPAGEVASLSGGTAAGWKSDPPDVIFAYVPDGRTRELEAFAEKEKIPLLVLSPEPTRMSLDPERPVLWAGGVRAPDEALQGMDFLVFPCGSKAPALLHDGSPRAVEAAERAFRLHHVSQTPLPPAEVPSTFDRAAAAALVAERPAASGGTAAAPAGPTADGVLYFGGPEGAERLLRACVEADVKAPIVLGQGLASASVPTFAEGRAKTAWALEVVHFDDHDGIARDDQALLADAAKAASRASFPAAGLRAYRAARWVQQALAATRAGGAGGPEKADGKPGKKGADSRRLLPALRSIGWPGARGKTVFHPTGHANLPRFVPWRSAAEGKEPAFRWIRKTLVPMSGIPAIGTFDPKLFKWQEGTTHVQLTFGEGAARTIEADLRAIGIHTGGYEGDLEQRILDDLAGRLMSRLNRLFDRNPDGSEIPGISYRISFTLDPPPKEAKGPKLKMILGGDDPSTGGMATGTTAYVYTTFIQRTLYAQHALTPPIGASDRPYLTGAYKWGTSVEQNLRCDSVRALLDGYSQGLALTGAHEVGHICGPGHDQVSPRSIMNVVEAVGLDFEWAEWIPEHARMLERFLKRHPAEKDPK